MVTHLAVVLRHSKDFLAYSSNSQPSKPNIYLQIMVVMQVFVGAGGCCKLKVTTVTNGKYRLNEGPTGQQRMGGCQYVMGYDRKMHPLRTVCYLGSTVDDPQFKPAAIRRGGCRTETQGTSGTERHMYLLSVFLTEFPE